MREKKDYVMKYFSVIRILSAIVIALLIIFAIIFFVSEDPLFAIQKMVLGPFETKRSFFNVLERAVPLIFSALALNIVLRSGVFSIAADGSFYMGAVVATAVAIKVQLPNIAHQFVLIVAAGIIGGLISMLPIILNKYTKVDATVLSIMFNSIFYYLGYSIVSEYLLEKSGQWGSAYFPDTARLGKMIQGTSMHWGFLIMVAAIVLVIFLMEKTSFGYKVRVTGINPHFAKSAGIKTGSVILGAAFISGIVAGVGGAVEMVGMYKRFQWQTQVNYVWDGLMVHMLANENPYCIPLTAFFIAFLRIGAEIMSRATDLDNEIVAFLQCIVILLVGSERFLHALKARREQKAALQQVQAATVKGGGQNA
ncbi:MAG: ABC transporter permease [Lachnospiraceae bacterium]|nr:ABC transporter permease [Lachnospiraceae bacterium]